MMGVDAEIDGLRASVSRYFPVYQVTVNPFAITFHVSADPATLDADFDALRREFVPRNYVPSIVQEQGETLIHVQRRPETKFRGVYLNLLLLVVTIGTTWVAGAVNWEFYTDVPWLSLDSLFWGFVSFTVPLLLILGAHEMGHYLTARRHHVRASLPFFIPSVPILGTFGAFISMRDPIPNRKALLEIGVSGPLVGFALALPITVIGLFLNSAPTHAPPFTGSGEITMPSLLYGWMQGFFPGSLVDPFRRHPTAFAGWVGLFVTAINLLPAGQLDGGHVARALFGDKQRYVSLGATVLLVVLSIFYIGWALFAVIIIVLGLRHPPPLNDVTRLKPSRKALGWFAIAVLVLTFVPAPFLEVPSVASFSFETATVPHVVLTELDYNNWSAGWMRTISLNVNNTGDLPETVRVWIDPQNLDSFGWVIQIENYTRYRPGGSELVPVGANQTSMALNTTEYATLRVSVAVPMGATPQTYSWAILAKVVEPNTGVASFVQQLPVRITLV